MGNGSFSGTEAGWGCERGGGKGGAKWDGVLVMGWRYKVGLLLIGSVVVIWVASAEVTQVVACIHNPLTTTRRKRMPFVFPLFPHRSLLGFKPLGSHLVCLQ